MRLQARLAITVALAAALAILVMAAAFWVLGARQQRQVIDDQLLATISEPRQLLPEVNNRGGQRRGFGGVFEDDGATANRLFTRIRLVAPDGEVLLDDGLPELRLSNISGAQLSTVEIDGERFRMAASALPVRGNRNDALLQIAINIEDREAGLARFRVQLIVASVLGIALAAILGSLVARRLSSPITTVAAAAREMANSRQLPLPIDIDRTDEVGDLATSFNAMLSALELSREQQHRLVADASHELRTPLTSLRLKIDLLDSTPDLDEAQRRALLSNSASEVEQLGDLVTELVDLATDPTGVDEQPVSASLLQLASNVATIQQRRSGRQINVVASKDGTFLLREHMVTRAISNIIDNAIKYSPDDTAVTVVVDGARIEAQDNGAGIAPEDLPHVFDRFYRSATARTRPGNGIGLAIVRRVAEVHGGQVWAKNTDDGSGAIVGFSVAES